MASPEARVLASGVQDSHEGDLNIVVLGPEDTYSEGLAKARYFPRVGDLRVPVIRLTGSIDEVYETVVSNDFSGETVGLVPFENIPKGVITDNVMPLITGEHGIEVDIEEELICMVRLMLAAPKDKSTGRVIPLDEIEKVFSYRSALDQASKFMQANNLKGEPVASTAKAAELAARRARKGEKVAAICSVNAALHNGLDIIEEDVQDNKENNQTRFYVVTARNGGPGPDLGRLLVGSEMGGLADEDEAKVIGIVRPTRSWRESGYRLATRRLDEMGVVDYKLYRLNWQEDETIGGDRSHLVEFVGAPPTLHEAFSDPDTYADMKFQLLGVIPCGQKF